MDIWNSLLSLYCLQHPAIIGCDSIQDYEIWYRLVSEDTDDWDKERGPYAFPTLYRLTGLEQDAYVIRVVVSNNDGKDNFAEKTYGLGMTDRVQSLNSFKFDNYVFSTVGDSCC